MKIIHTADLHLGQIIYQNYDRSDEHMHFFHQLKRWCKEEKPDALVVSGDVFDIQQPSASTKKAFTEYFVDIHRECPDMHIVITAGNHDSASRIQADSAVWELAGTTLIGMAPIQNASEGWQERYIVRLQSGYIIAVPFLAAERKEVLQELLDTVEEENEAGKPVVMLGHTAVTGLDITGHNIEIGKLKTQDPDSFGNGYDYLALGHIHKPQTIAHPEDSMKEDCSYDAPVIRYSGSVLHVSCDEAYPHSVSLVDIDKHGGKVHVKQLRINELRHFYILPEDGSDFSNADDVIKAVQQFCSDNKSGYFRLRIVNTTDLPANFNQQIYDALALTNDKIRYNPKIIWTGVPTDGSSSKEKPTFEVAELQQMTDPVTFIEKTKEQYPGLDMADVRQAFQEVEAELVRMEEEEKEKAAAKAANKKKASKNSTEQITSEEE